MQRCDFRWVLEGRLAGSSKPGLLTSIERDMSFLQEQGIRLVVTLTEDPLKPPPTFFGFESLHFPIPDMGVPTVHAAAGLCGQVLGSLERAEPVVLHCKAGIGRTGMMLACCLVALGRSPGEAIAAVRAGSGQSIQTDAQTDFVFHFAEFLAQRAG